jgi:hypothetical protein
VHEAGLGALHRGWVESFHGVSLKAELAVWVTTASGASLPLDDASVAAASWGSADPFERCAHGAG